MGIQELEEVRRQKLEFVREQQNPYPERFSITHELMEAIKLEDGTKEVSVAGRILSIRKMGKLCFVTISDIYGRLQIAIRRDDVGDKAYEFFRQGFDIGDFLGVVGEIFTTQTGEKTVRAKNLTFLGKAFKPLPEKFHGITDKDS